MKTYIKKSLDIIHSIYGDHGFIPLHAPVFLGNEKEYLNECIDSTFVSSVGEFVDRFEKMVQDYTGAAKAVAVVNGTNGLHLALRLVGVRENTEVITQALTFVATSNAIHYEKAHPVFVDVDKDTMGLSPGKLNDFLNLYAEKTKDGVINRSSGRYIKAILPMHTFGHPLRIQEIVSIGREWGIPVVEDAAESLGSTIDMKHTGLLGDIGVISFNGNKSITTGGGGMLITQNEALGIQAKYISSTAKVPSKWEFNHDEIGFNYRMPNINAALGCAQMESLDKILANKRNTAARYSGLFKEIGEVDFVEERPGTTANYWLNTLIMKNREERDEFLKASNELGIQTRPAWNLMHRLPMNTGAQRDELEISQWLEDRIVNIPSSATL